ncbi:MAG: hypothetical protein Q9164_004230 [Protoblastenia rupestris]
MSTPTLPSRIPSTKFNFRHALQLPPPLVDFQNIANPIVDKRCGVFLLPRKTTRKSLSEPLVSFDAEQDGLPTWNSTISIHAGRNGEPYLYLFFWHGNGDVNEAVPPVRSHHFSIVWRLGVICDGLPMLQDLRLDDVSETKDKAGNFVFSDYALEDDQHRSRIMSLAFTSNRAMISHIDESTKNALRPCLRECLDLLCSGEDAVEIVICFLQAFRVQATAQNCISLLKSYAEKQPLEHRYFSDGDGEARCLYHNLELNTELELEMGDWARVELQEESPKKYTFAHGPVILKGLKAPGTSLPCTISVNHSNSFIGDLNDDFARRVMEVDFVATADEAPAIRLAHRALDGKMRMKVWSMDDHIHGKWAIDDFSIVRCVDEFNSEVYLPQEISEKCASLAERERLVCINFEAAPHVFSSGEGRWWEKADMETRKALDTMFLGLSSYHLRIWVKCPEDYGMTKFERECLAYFTAVYEKRQKPFTGVNCGDE